MITKINIKGLELEVEYQYIPSEPETGSGASVYIKSIYYQDEDFSEFELIWDDDIRENIIKLERGY